MYDYNWISYQIRKVNRNISINIQGWRMKKNLWEMLQSSIHGGLYIMDRNLTHDEEGVGVGVGVRNYVETLYILNLVSFYVWFVLVFMF